MSATRESTARWFFLVLMVFATLLLALLIRPIASPLFMAAVLAGVLWPVQQAIAARVRGRRGVAAGLITSTVVLIIVGPLVAISAFVVQQGAAGVKYVATTVRSEGVAGVIADLPAPLQRSANELVERLSPDSGADLDAAVKETVASQGGSASAAMGRALSATGSLLFQAALMLIALFSLLVQGDKFVAWLDSASPLRPGQTRELLQGFKRVSYAVIMSTVVTAAVQALAALAGYAIARVPHPLFFAGLTFFVAFIPAVGAASVCLAAAVLLVVTGHPYMSIFLAAWGVLVVGLVDNVIKPLLIKRGMELHGAVVFFALIGGLAAFGPTGLLIGPLVVALFLALLRMYQRDFAPLVPPPPPGAVAPPPAPAPPVSDSAASPA